MDDLGVPPFKETRKSKRYIELLEEVLEDVTNLTKIKRLKTPRAPNMIQLVGGFNPSEKY